jgi:serine/threonine protein phosphatase PrpC
VPVTNPSSSMKPTPNPDSPNAEVIVRVAGLTDVGRTREHNEDAFVVADLTGGTTIAEPDSATLPAGAKGSLFMVADGMGGAAAGEIASAMAVDIVLGELRATWVAAKTTDAEVFVRAIKDATKAANAQINAFATQHPEYRGMGTTATIAGLLGDTLYLAQVGDSRAYIVRDGVTRQITKDQSLMQKLIEAGELTEEEAEHSERRNIILQALGPEGTIKVDLTHQTIRRGDTLVLCSDGLSGQVSKDQIAEIVRREPDLTKVSQGLIDLANAAGGPDNITVIVARFEGMGLTAAANEDEVGHRVFPLRDSGPSGSWDRIMTGTTPTEPMPIVPRADMVRPTPPRAVEHALSPAQEEPAPSEKPVTPATPEPLAALEVSPARRSVGTLIAVALLTLLIIGAVWFVMRSTGAVTATTGTSAPRS